MTTTALLIVDTQVDFTEGGRLAVEGGKAAAAGITDLLSRAGDRYAAVAATKDWHTPDTRDHFPATTDDPPDLDAGLWPVHCMAGTPGAQFDPALVLPERTAIFLKGQTEASYSGFDGTLAADTPWDDEAGVGLREWLASRDIDTVHIVGIAFDVCVASTATDAAAAGLDTTVIRPLTAAVSPELTEAAEAQLRGAGVHIAEAVPA